MEQGKFGDNISDFPIIPDDTAELITDVKDRETQRQHAIDLMLEKAAAAISDDERDMWIEKVKEFQSIHDEYIRTYPEVFPDDSSKT